MLYKQILPGEILQDYIRYFWILEGDSPAKIRAVADGCPGIIFHNTAQGLFLNDSDKLSGIFLYGQTVLPVEMSSPGKFFLTGLYFYPHVMKSLFGFNADELTDSCIDLALLPDSASINLNEKLLNTVSPEKQISIISCYIESLIRKKDISTDNMLHFAVRHLMNSNGNISLSALQEKLNLSQRTFERKFIKHIGIPPKLFSRICRFQSSLSQLGKRYYDKLSDVALDNGFADQSHFIRTFKEFSGFSPGQLKDEPYKMIPDSPLFIKA